MAMNSVKQTLTTVEQSPFDSILRMKSLMMTSAALNPLTTGASEKYKIHAGTPVGPVGNGFVAPVVRSRITTTAPSGSVTVYVNDATGFVAGDGILYYTSLNGTAAAATISSVTDATNMIVLVSSITASAGDFLEKGVNGAHGNTTVANPVQIPDVCILLADVEVLAADDTTNIPVECVGVDLGSIRVGNLTGSCCSTFDTMLRAQLPGIRFDNTTVGS